MQQDRLKKISASNQFLDTIRSQLLWLMKNETFLYVVKRLLEGLITLFLISALSFFIIKLSPVDPFADLAQNPRISPETIAAKRQQFGLDKPAIEQYWLWLKSVVFSWDFGPSIYYSFRPVSELIGSRIRATLELSIAAIIVTWAIAIPLGIIGAVNQNKFIDRLLRIITYTAQGFPSFITALFLLIIAQYTTPLFPVGGRTSINHESLSPIGQLLDIGWHMILPTIALSITSFAGLQRIMRGELLDVLRQDYIQTARAKGLPENRVIYIHALRNAINPLITLLGFEFSSLLSGAFIGEIFFNWPGLGRLTFQAVKSNDLYLIMATLVLSSVMLIVGNLLGDLLLKFVDPRIKLSEFK